MPSSCADATRPKVAVVIPNHNGAAWLDGCFGGLARQEFRDFIVVLVDNGSTDGSADRARRLRPALRLVRLGENRGFAAAVNAGIAASTSEYVALLNTDTVAGSAWLSVLVQSLDGSPSVVAAVAPRMMRLDDPDTIDDAGNTLCWTGAADKRGHGKAASEFARRDDIFSPSAGASLYRRSFLQEMGGFDERYFAYLEDVDLGLRGRLCGYRFLYEPDAVVLHKGHGSGMMHGRYVQLVTRNRLLLFAKSIPLGLLVRRLPSLVRGQLYFLFAYRSPLRSVAGYASFLGLVPHAVRERRRMKRSRRITSAEIDRMLAPGSREPLLRVALLRRLGLRP